ncbi:MAG: hypothetical protein ABL872_08915 [Lacibacter sp.]
MRKIILFAATCCLLQSTFAESIFPSAPLSKFSLIVQPQIKVVPENTVHKRMTLKERLLMKWYKKKMNRTVSEEKQKKNIKTLGLLSILVALIGPFAALLAFTSASPGIFFAAGIAFCLTAIILGFISLKRRKKLTDKTGTSKVPALIGIILGGLAILIPLIFIIGLSLFYE